MNPRNTLLTLTFLFLTTACRDSAVDSGPAATVAETPTATAEPGSQPAHGTPVGRIIKEKSTIEFAGAKVTRDHHGAIKDFDGWIEYAANKPSRVAFEMNLDTLETDSEKLTGHLKSADFFDVAKYPKATFTSTTLREAPASAQPGVTHELTGTLDLHGVSKDVTIPVTATVTPEGVRTKSEFTIDRHDWGISYKGAADDLIKNNVLIKLDLMFPPPPAA